MTDCVTDGCPMFQSCKSSMIYTPCRPTKLFQGYMRHLFKGVKHLFLIPPAALSSMLLLLEVVNSVRLHALCVPSGWVPVAVRCGGLRFAENSSQFIGAQEGEGGTSDQNTLGITFFNFTGTTPAGTQRVLCGLTTNNLTGASWDVDTSKSFAKC